jgi:hypothetical protein
MTVPKTGRRTEISEMRMKESWQMRDVAHRVKRAGAAQQGGAARSPFKPRTALDVREFFLHEAREHARNAG